MAKSGVYTYALTLNQAIEEALDMLMTGSDGETLSGNVQARAIRSVNILLKHWENYGLHLWTKPRGALFLAKGQSRYDLASSKLSNTWYETTTSAAAASGASTIVVTDASNIQASDTIGILLATNDLFWTTVNGAPAGTTVTLSSVLTGAVSSGAVVYNYRDTFQPILRLCHTSRRESSTYELPITLKSEEEYFRLPDKATEGTALQVYHDAQHPTGVIYIWQPPSTAKHVLTFTYERKIQVSTANSHDLDLPDEFMMAFVTNVAYLMAFKLGIDEKRIAYLEKMAISSLNLALGFDSVQAGIFLKVR